MKSLLIVTALAESVSAAADVRYVFTSVFGSFSLVASGPITVARVLKANRLANPKGFLRSKIVSVEFRPNRSMSDTLIVTQDDGHAYTFVFRRGSFAGYGPRATTVGIRGRLTVVRVPAARQSGSRPYAAAVSRRGANSPTKAPATTSPPPTAPHGPSRSPARVPKTAAQTGSKA